MLARLVVNFKKFTISAKLTLVGNQNQGPGLVQMDNISESYLVQVAEEGVILLVLNAE